MKKKKYKNTIFPKKALITIFFKDDKRKYITVSGEGSVDAVKNTSGEFIFTGIIRKNYE